jgi:hypothetical protein
MTDTFIHPNSHRRFRCSCERPIFFDNSECLACGAQLGYFADSGVVAPLSAGPTKGLWTRLTDVLDSSADSRVEPVEYYRCRNFESHAGCNWMVAAVDHQRGQALCVACRLNRTIPDLTRDDNAQLWRSIEVAKRRLISSLLALGLPVQARCGEDPLQGVMFDFLRAEPGCGAVMTGHINGLITLNVEEANDAQREHVRIAMHEPYRTLLGHLRHEIGHYYWDRLVSGTPWYRNFRELFGDETRDYAAALQWQRWNGPPDDWQRHYVSSYAATHPWEDWAESWAHYLHMLDMLDTALSFGLDAAAVELDIEPFGPEALYQPGAAGAAEFLVIVNLATKLTGVLNELSRGMGLPDFYPFVLSKNAVRKLQLVHQVVRQWAPVRHSETLQVTAFDSSDTHNAILWQWL